jgi:hypothetical protein
MIHEIDKRYEIKLLQKFYDMILLNKYQNDPI